MNGIPDIESQVFTEVTEALEAADPAVYTIGAPEDVPERLPCVCIYEASNTPHENSRETENSEVLSDLEYQVDVYTNDVNGKVARAKVLRNTVAEYFKSIGFTRSLATPLPNYSDPSIYRYTMRFYASMNAKKQTYRR